MLVNCGPHDMQVRKRIQYLLKVSISITCSWFAGSIDVGFIHHCEQGRALLRSVMKHVKACAQ